MKCLLTTIPCWSYLERDCSKPVSTSRRITAGTSKFWRTHRHHGFGDLYETLALNNAMNGLIRMSALRQTRLIEPYIGADVVLMGHLALLGKYRLLDERLLYRRMDSATATALQDRSAVWRHHYPQLNAHALFQGTKRLAGLLRVALSAPDSRRERVTSFRYALKICYWNRALFSQDVRGIWRYFARGAWPD